MVAVNRHEHTAADAAENAGLPAGSIRQQERGTRIGTRGGLPARPLERVGGADLTGPILAVAREHLTMRELEPIAADWSAVVIWKVQQRVKRSDLPPLRDPRTYARRVARTTLVHELRYPGYLATQRLIMRRQLEHEREQAAIVRNQVEASLELADEERGNREQTRQ